jgi:hypothetical protein
MNSDRRHFQRAALKQLSVYADSGMAYVVILHLSPGSTIVVSASKYRVPSEKS